MTSCSTKPGVIERQVGMEGRPLGLGCPGIFHPLRAALGTSSHAFAGSSKLHCSVSSSLNTTSGRIPFPAALRARGLGPRCGPKLKPCSSSQLCLSEQGYSSSIGSPSLLLQGWGHQGSRPVHTCSSQAEKAAFCRTPLESEVTASLCPCCSHQSQQDGASGHTQPANTGMLGSRFLFID